MAQRKISFGYLLWTLILGELVCSLETNMIFLALSHLYRIYGDPIHVSWLVTVYTLTAAAAAAICSRLGDLYGRKRMLVIMLGTALIGSLISAVAQDLNVIIFGRALQGASMAVLPLCYGLLREHAPPERIPFGVGMLGGTFTFASGLAALAGGYIVDNYDWQAIFFVSGGLAIVAIAFALVALPPSKVSVKDGTKLDVLGGLIFVPAIAALLLAISQGSRWGWTSGWTLGLIAGGLLFLIVWVRHELRHQEPLINIRLLAKAQIGLSNLCAFVFGMGPVLTSLILLPFIQQPLWSGTGLGQSGLETGALKIAATLTAGCAVIVAGHFATRYHPRLMVVSSTIVCGFCWTVLTFEPGSYLLVAGILIVLLTPATAIFFANIPALIIEASPEDRTSEATGLTQVIRSVATAIGSQLVAWILTTSTVVNPDGSGESLPSPAAYAALFASMAALSAAAMIVALAIPRARKRVAAAKGGLPGSE